MIKKVAAIAILLMLLLPLCVSTTAIAGRSGTFVVKPLKGTFWGTWATTAYDGTVKAHDVGTALLTHLGRSTFDGYLTTDWSDPYNGIVGGTMTVVAANGDRLNFDLVGTQTPNQFFTQAQFTGTYTLTGGTGRFAGATGDGTISALLTIESDLIHGLITNGEISGTIKLPLP
jgi:hypothetical protein